MDLYAKLTGETSDRKLVAVGKLFVVVFVILAALLAPHLESFGGIFAYIQEFQGFISPGILAVFIFGFFSPRTPRYFGWLGIVINVIAYAVLKWLAGPWLAVNGFWYSPEMAFLDRMAVCFFLVVGVGLIATKATPLATPVLLPVNHSIALESSRTAKIGGAIVCVITIGFYLMFR
jgi:SSS family solute:Na+ symporter